MGTSPLHASTVGLILNPQTNRLSPQFHCVYDDWFETVHSNYTTPPKVWEELVINSRFRNKIEEDTNLEDTWEAPKESNKDPPDLRRPGEGSDTPLNIPIA